MRIVKGVDPSLFSSRRSYLFDFCLVVRKVRLGETILTEKFCNNFFSSKRHLHLEKRVWLGNLLRILPPCVDYLSTLFLNPGGVFKENLLSGSLPLLSPRSNLTLIRSFSVSANWTNFRQIWESLSDARAAADFDFYQKVKAQLPRNHQRKGFSFCGNMLRFNPKRAESQFARPKTAMTDTLHTQTFHLYLIFKILFCLSTHLHSQWPSLDLTQLACKESFFLLSCLCNVLLFQFVIFFLYALSQPSTTLSSAAYLPRWNNIIIQ